MQQNSLMEDSFGTFDDSRVLAEKDDITKMASDFGGWQASTRECLHFGTRQTRSIKGLKHWAQDFYHITFKQQLGRALVWAEI